MTLPDLFSSSSDAEQLLLAVVLTNTTIQSALWGVKDGHIQVVETSSIQTYRDEKSCVVATDQSLQELGKQSEKANEVLFGLAPDWVGASGLVDVRKPLLKHLTDELSLKAVGYVVIPEAVAHQLVDQEPMLSALVLALTPDQWWVMEIQRGKPVAVEQVGRSGESVADITEGLARLSQRAHKQADTHWPAKMWIVPVGVTSKEAGDEQQVLLANAWVNDERFLHQPVIELQPDSLLVEAVVRQGGRAAAQEKGIEVAREPAHHGGDAHAHSHSAHQALPTPPVGDEHANVAPAEFGFNEVSDDSAADELAIEPTQATARSFGIPIAAKHLPFGKKSAEPELAVEHHAHHGHAPKNSWQRWWRAHRGFVAAGVGAGLVALVGVGYFMLLLTTQVEALVTLKTKPIAQEVEITLDPRASSSDPAQRILAAKVVTAEIAGSQTVDTTGVKLVGEKAKGTVTILNKTDSTKNFAAGTKLSTGKLVFTLDKDVTVASASVSERGNDGETKTYGKVDVEAVAAVIGADSNIGVDTDLKVADFATTTYAAVVKTAFSGGSSREVRVVAEKDRQNVLAALKADATKQAETKLKEQAASGEYIVPTGKVVVNEAEYDAKVGDEVNSVSLTASAVVEAVSYRAEDLSPLAQAVLAGQVPANYKLSDQAPQILSDASGANVASGSSTVKLKASLSSVAVPLVDVENWKREVAGQSKTTAQERLQGKAEIAGVKFNFQPGIAEKLRPVLPNKADRITITTTP